MYGLKHLFASTSTSERAKHQRVLLCRDCNSRSGLQGEGALTEFEAFRRTREAGQFYRASTQVFQSESFHEPAELGSIPVEFRKDKKGLTLTFPVRKKRASRYKSKGEAKI